MTENLFNTTSTGLIVGVTFIASISLYFIYSHLYSARYENIVPNDNSPDNSPDNYLDLKTILYDIPYKDIYEQTYQIVHNNRISAEVLNYQINTAAEYNAVKIAIQSALVDEFNYQNIIPNFLKFYKETPEAIDKFKEIVYYFHYTHQYSFMQQGHFKYIALKKIRELYNIPFSTDVIPEFIDLEITLRRIAISLNFDLDEYQSEILHEIYMNLKHLAIIF
uniref:Uncharacterized protein n=1 Tax=Dactylella sp. TaxID=1814903 RepID=A0A482DT16_9PEZI|nr:hypothetical protein [Dactylella sp.]